MPKVNQGWFSAWCLWFPVVSAMIQDYTTRANSYLSTTCVNTVFSHISSLSCEKYLFPCFNCYLYPYAFMAILKGILQWTGIPSQDYGTHSFIVGCYICPRVWCSAWCPVCIRWPIYKSLYIFLNNNIFCKLQFGLKQQYSMELYVDAARKIESLWDSWSFKWLV